MYTTRTKRRVRAPPHRELKIAAPVQLWTIVYFTNRQRLPSSANQCILGKVRLIQSTKETAKECWILKSNIGRNLGLIRYMVCKLTSKSFKACSI